MLGYFVVGILAAYGLMGILWALFGWLLPDGKGCAVCCYEMPDEGILWRYRWLRALGLWQIPLLVVTEDGQTDATEVELCSREQLASRLEEERKRNHGTGNGDHTGCHQRRDLSEL